MYTEIHGRYFDSIIRGSLLMHLGVLNENIKNGSRDHESFFLIGRLADWNLVRIGQIANELVVELGEWEESHGQIVAKMTVKGRVEE
jgi:hypothetical protein